MHALQVKKMSVDADWQIIKQFKKVINFSAMNDQYQSAPTGSVPESNTGSLR